MPTVAAAVAAYTAWPVVPVGWTRHMTKAGNLYPEEDHEKDAVTRSGYTDVVRRGTMGG